MISPCPYRITKCVLIACNTHVVCVICVAYLRVGVSVHLIKKFRLPQSVARYVCLGRGMPGIAVHLVPRATLKRQRIACLCVVVGLFFCFGVGPFLGFRRALPSMRRSWLCTGSYDGSVRFL